MNEQPDSPKRLRTGSILAAIFAVLTVGYFLVLAHLAANTVQQKNVFPSKLEQLTDMYVSYLDPAGDLTTRAAAKAWLERAQEDLRSREQETILLKEVQTWIEILGQIPQDLHFDDLIEAEDDEVIRRALRTLRDEAVKADQPAPSTVENDASTPEELMNQLGGFAYVVYFKMQYLAGTGPLNRTLDLREMLFEKGRVSDVLRDLERARDRIMDRQKKAVSRLTVDDALKEDAAFIKAVNELRSKQAPEEAKARLIFFGPICLRRLSESLDAPSQNLRERAWATVLVITAFGQKEIDDIAYRPDAGSAARRQAIARLADLCWKPKDWPDSLEPGLKYIY